MTWTQIIQSLALQLIFFVGLYYLLIEILITITFFYIICYYFQRKVMKLRNSILNIKYSMKTRKKVRYSSITNTIEDMDFICSKISKYNKFWKSVVLYFILTMIPVNLCSMNQLIWSDLNFYVIILTVLFIVYTWIFIFFISYCMATISYHIHNNIDDLLSIQYKIIGNVHLKVKLLNSFERISNAKKIGFEVKNLFVMTYPTLYRVSLPLFQASLTSTFLRGYFD